LQIGALNRFLPMVVPLDGQKCEMTLQQFVNARRRLLPSVAKCCQTFPAVLGTLVRIFRPSSTAMIEPIAIAFDRQDYKTAAALLKQLQARSPDHPWLKVYVGRLKEGTGNLEAAESIYRQVLRDSVNAKVALAARQGLERIETTVQAAQKAAQAEAMAQVADAPGSDELAIFVLEPVVGEQRDSIARNFAKVSGLDGYTARLNLPSRGWKLYRTGNAAELKVLSQTYQKSGVPAFWFGLSALQQIRVFQVRCLDAIAPKPTVICQDEVGQVGVLPFDWSEVGQRVEGLLPVLSRVVDRDVAQKMVRKVEARDYAHVVDLHLPKRRCILRFCDRNYQFQEGLLFAPENTPSAHITTQMRWRLLTEMLYRPLAKTQLWQDFTPFGETAIEQVQLLEQIPAHIDLFQPEPSFWEPAFHLYSCIIFNHRR
jgi:Tetratricopeptide repeat